MSPVQERNTPNARAEDVLTVHLAMPPGGSQASFGGSKSPGTVDGEEARTLVATHPPLPIRHNLYFYRAAIRGP